MVYDETQNYDNSFHVGGAMMLTGGLLLCVLHLPQLRRSTASVKLVHADTETESVSVSAENEKKVSPHGTRVKSNRHKNEMTLTVAWRHRQRLQSWLL